MGVNKYGWTLYVDTIGPSGLTSCWGMPQLDKAEIAENQAGWQQNSENAKRGVTATSAQESAM